MQNNLIFKVEESDNIFLVEVSLNGQSCANARLILEDEKVFLQKIAVAAPFQNKGIGSQLLKFCEEFACENKCNVIYAHARESSGRSVVNFYLKNEYFCGDEEFFEDEAAHKIVWKILN